MSTGNEIIGNWYAKKYEGEQAKRIFGHIREGTGYVELESGTGYVVVAFRAVDPPPSANLITDQRQIEALERRRKVNKQRRVKKPNTKLVKEIFFKGGEK
jgi:hypothetical protein